MRNFLLGFLAATALVGAIAYAAAGSLICARPVVANPSCAAENKGEMVLSGDAGLMYCNGSAFVAP